jgi:hypothetical protein
MASPPSNLAEIRPDIAAMQEQIPQPGPNSVDMQADAHREKRPDIGTGQYIEYAGQPFYLKHTPDAFDLADLAEYMEGAAAQPIRALGGINARLRLWFVDYEALRTTFREKNAGIDLERQMGEYGELASKLFETLAARPTEAPADTSTGRTPTSTSSKDGSPSADGSPSTDPSPSETSTPG